MEVYDRYSSLVYALSLQVLRSPQSSEDIVQDIFLRLWLQAKTYNSARGSLAGWITVMTRHQAIDRLRKEQRESQLPDATVPIAINVGLQRREDRWAEISVRSILERLPTEQREVLDLAYFRGLSQTEIATSTGLPLGTVKSRVRLALQTLRRLLHTNRVIRQ